MDYTLQFSKSFDSVNKSSYTYFQCGGDGNIAGLDHMFQHTYIRDIPYLKTVEVPIAFADTDLCTSYKKIALQITATCERPTTRSEVYQYEVLYQEASGTIAVQYDKRRGAENSSAYIDEMSWEPAPPPSSSATSSTAASSCNCNGLSGGPESYYSGYGGGVGGGTANGGSGGGKAIASVEEVGTSYSSDCFH